MNLLSSSFHGNIKNILLNKIVFVGIWTCCCLNTKNTIVAQSYSVTPQCWEPADGSETPIRYLIFDRNNPRAVSQSDSFSGSFSRLFPCCSFNAWLNSAHCSQSCAMVPKSASQILAGCVPVLHGTEMSQQYPSAGAQSTPPFCFRRFAFLQVCIGGTEIYQGKITSGKPDSSPWCIKRNSTRIQTLQQPNLRRSPKQSRFCIFFCAY